MMELLDLCYDVLVRILEEVEPADLAACAQTSRGFNAFIKKNVRLHKAHYLRNFDDCRHHRHRLHHHHHQDLVDLEPDWISELQKLVKCQKILQSANNDVKRDEFKFVASTIDSLISSSSTDELGYSRNRQFVDCHFRSIGQNHDAFMRRSSLLNRSGKLAPKQAESEDERQLSAKLHCLFGIPSNDVGDKVLSTHPYARSRVYDLRKYTDQTNWGPLRSDGSLRADWEMIESLMIVLSYKSGPCCRQFVQRFRPPWFDPFEGVIPEPAKAMLLQPDVPLRLQDPYHVSGVWSRIVCFLDYRDFYDFNFNADAVALLPDQPRGSLSTEEAVRHIIMDLHVTAVVAPGPHENPALPVVHFRGKSRSVDASWDPNARSKIRGTVSLTPSGEVRWRTVSIFGGEERWCGEGIQVGGPRSQRGVIGTWFDKDHDPHGPVGPTAFWKICDNNLSTGRCDGGDNEADSDEDGSWYI